MQYVIFWDLDFFSLNIKFIHILCFAIKDKKSRFLCFELRKINYDFHMLFHCVYFYQFIHSVFRMSTLSHTGVY